MHLEATKEGKMFTFHKMVGAALLAAAVFFLNACAETQPRDQQVPETQNPVALVNGFDSQIANARKNRLNVLSPTWFAKAETSLAKAKEGLGQGDEISIIFQDVADGKAHLQRAEEMARVARTTLPDLIKSRDLARAAGATNLEDYASVENRFIALTKAIEKNNLRLAQRDRGKVSEAFRDLELRAIKDQTIGEVRKLLSEAKQKGAKKYAPESYALGQQKLKDTDTFITENPYEKEKMLAMAAEALFYAERLTQINAQSQKIRDMQSEPVAVWMESTLHEVTNKLSAPDMRNEPFEIQVENVLGSISALQADHDFLMSKAEDQQNQINDLKLQIIVLEGQTKEQQMAQQRLAAEKEFNEKFTKIQYYFDPDEAEVYKQGNQLVIRLRKIQFPVGKAFIKPSNYELLSKVQRAIRIFGESTVVIEGHTDSTGSDEVNEHLSQKRAESVREYLVANRTLSGERIVAVGYGEVRPLASNKTAEGRAINRRIDVIIKPMLQAGI